MKTKSINIIQFSVLLACGFLIATTGNAQADSHDHVHQAPATHSTHEQLAAAVQPDETIVRVQGVVCSFCAYGLQKKLSKLDGVNKEKHDKGVKVDIADQTVKIAGKPDASPDINLIFETVRDAGYEPVIAWQRSGSEAAIEFKPEN